MKSTLRPRICQIEKGGCGRTFQGGPRAWFCPACRDDRRREAARLSKARQRRGLTRRLGSEDVCEVCGGTYTVKSANQRYCSECSPCVIMENDAEQGMEYYKANADTLNPARNTKRRKEAYIPIPCPVPGCNNLFVKKGRAVVCPSCRPAWRKERQGAVDAARRPAKNENDPRQRRIDWSQYDHLLGTMPDNRVAKAIGCSTGTVIFRRRGLGIPKYAPEHGEHSLIDWTKYDHLLGTVSDKKVSGIIGCNPATVSNRRRKMGIPASIQNPGGPESVDWSIYDRLLGTMSDRRLASKIGCYYMTVTNRRLKLGIGAHIDNSIDWSKYDQLLGSMPDRKLSQIIGCVTQSVTYRRRQLGIPPRNKKVAKIQDNLHLLGTVSDINLAEIMGCSTDLVGTLRECLGIHPFKTIASDEK